MGFQSRRVMNISNEDILPIPRGDTIIIPRMDYTNGSLRNWRETKGRSNDERWIIILDWIRMDHKCPGFDKSTWIDGRRLG